MTNSITLSDNGFDLTLPEIANVNHSDEGVQVSSKEKTYRLLTPDVEEILRIITLMNNAQDPPSAPAYTKKETIAGKEEQAIAAFVRYSSFGGKPIAKRRDEYPSYFNYKFGITAPIKSHKKMIEEGYLCEAPLATSLALLKVEQLKQILRNDGLPENGKKGELIQRIVENVDPTTLSVEAVYIPTEKGLNILKKYEDLFA